MVYYNENEPYAAQWLRNLIAAGHIAHGHVDERSIEDVFPNDLKGYTQCHFFAGIGVWSYALRLAGWSDDRPVWTGSCPCQPFSAAGKKKRFVDDRHLWPAWLHLIHHAKPAGVPVYGEQVASPDGLAWFDVVSADLEGSGNTVRAVDMCVAGVGAPGIRQRLFFMAHPTHDGWGKERAQLGLNGGNPAQGGATGFEPSGESGDVGHAYYTGLQRRPVLRADSHGGGSGGVVAWAPSPVSGFWANADWIACIDGKRRPVEPGTFPLDYGSSTRVGRLRAYGNAINPYVAAEFIAATQ
jgi:DNA (cytosine-5)-methyltransferase 1